MPGANDGEFYGPFTGASRYGRVTKRIADERIEAVKHDMDDICRDMGETVEEHAERFRDNYTAEAWRALEADLVGQIKAHSAYVSGPHPSTVFLLAVVDILGGSGILSKAEYVRLAQDIKKKRDERKPVAADGTQKQEVNLIELLRQQGVLTAEMQAQMAKSNDTFASILAHKARPAITAHDLDREQFRTLTPDPDKLMRQVARLAGEGNVTPEIFSLAYLACLDWDKKVGESDFIQVIWYSMFRRNGTVSIEAANHFAAKTDADKRQLHRLKEVGGNGVQPLISELTTEPEMCALKGKLDSGTNEQHDGLNAPAGGGKRRPLTSPFGQASLAQTMRAADLTAIQRGAKISADLLRDVEEFQRRLNRDIDVEGGEVRIRTLDEEPKVDKIEYWVNLFGADGDVHLKADFKDLAKVIIEMRERGELNGAALRSISKRLAAVERAVQAKFAAGRHNGRVRGGGEAPNAAASDADFNSALKDACSGRDRRISEFRRDLNAAKADRDRLLKKIRETEPGFQ